MTTMASQITSLTIVYSMVYSDADQRKHQSSASLAFVRGIHQGPVNSWTNGQLRGKYFHLMTSSCHISTDREWLRYLEFRWDLFAQWDLRLHLSSIARLSRLTNGRFSPRLYQSWESTNHHDVIYWAWDRYIIWYLGSMYSVNTLIMVQWNYFQVFVQRFFTTSACS